ncbi:uncharacterized protein LOC105782629 isoform X1 [Gossypium raimondii]|uniref:uncharacterized protein LOC105782629 isoform X1 n=1 Tax=Gossypium raimondii TaxID=29730 RepID=UPI00063ACB15|nr:uncharacterized protein LOC105782629 isoform X1 [Gossypium raimondii]
MHFIQKICPLHEINVLFTFVLFPFSFWIRHGEKLLDACRIAYVLYEVLKTVIAGPQALADRESIKARSELFAYNILPLDHGGISGAPQDNNIMLWNAVIFGLDDTPWDGGNKVNNIDDYYFDYLWCEDYKYIKVIFSDCRETSASQPRVHEDWITRNVADVVCVVFFITKIYLIKKMHCIFYYLAMCIVIGKFN